jgi:TIR domain
MYDAFISYAHSKDRSVALALQSLIQTLGKPWYRRRILRVFRDETSITANPDLWETIETALSGSRFLILLASREAAASHWVCQEVEWWLANRSHSSILIALTDGDLSWDNAKHDFLDGPDLAAPATLKGALKNEPFWIDLREYRLAPETATKGNSNFLAQAANFAAALQGIPKEDLLSAEVTQQRRALSLAFAAGAVLLILAIAATWEAFVATNAQRLAERQRDRAQHALDRVDRTKLGIALTGWGGTTSVLEFNNKCYYYGDGGYDISVSNEYLGRYVARGFSLNSLCMALVSPVLFDPESGARLPTYVLVDLKAVDRDQAEAGTISDELPLEVPDCFRRGLPYTDCAMNYDMLTGAKLAVDQTQSFHELGAALERLLRVAIAEGVACDDFMRVENKCKPVEKWGDAEGDGHELIKQALAPEGYSLSDLSDRIANADARLPQALLQISKAAFYDVSNKLPAGFGYAINAEGIASGEDSGTGREVLDRIGGVKGGVKK